MNKDELITKQQLEIEKLEEANRAYEDALHNIHLMLISIGGPLNDNYHQYSTNQLVIFRAIEKETYVTDQFDENEDNFY